MGSSSGQMDQLSGASLERGDLDTTDGLLGVSQASQELDKQCEKTKVRVLACLHSAGGVSSVLFTSPYHPCP